MSALPVNEIFDTIQGEAAFTGTPSVFVRLQGCAVGCPWCDTKHTWAIADRDEISIADMLAKVDDAPTFARVPIEQLATIAKAYPARHVVITGGEPCDHDLIDLTCRIADAGKTVQIETSGTSPVRAVPDAWVTLSPKIDMPGGKVVLRDAVSRANEIKIPVGKIADVERLDAFIEQHRESIRTNLIWLQPLSQSPKATALCTLWATRRGWRVSIQTHKFLGVR